MTYTVHPLSRSHFSISNDCSVKNAVSLKSDIDIQCYYDAIPYLNVK